MAKKKKKKGKSSSAGQKGSGASYSMGSRLKTRTTKRAAYRSAKAKVTSGGR